MYIYLFIYTYIHLLICTCRWIILFSLPFYLCEYLQFNLTLAAWAVDVVYKWLNGINCCYIVVTAAKMNFISLRIINEKSLEYECGTRRLLPPLFFWFLPSSQTYSCIYESPVQTRAVLCLAGRGCWFHLSVSPFILYSYNLWTNLYIFSKLAYKLSPEWIWWVQIWQWWRHHLLNAPTVDTSKPRIWIMAKTNITHLSDRCRWDSVFLWY